MSNFGSVPSLLPAKIMNQNNSLQSAPLDAATPTENIDELLARINGLTAGAPFTTEPPSSSRAISASSPIASLMKNQTEASPDANRAEDGSYFPAEPTSQLGSSVSDSMMEELICKFLLAKGEATIRSISDQICMPYKLTEDCITKLKAEQVLGYVDQSAMNGYMCKLTESGRSRAATYSAFCSYFGAAPVSFNAYVASVSAQTINDQSPSEEDLNRAFSDLLIDPAMMVKLGPAVNSGKGMFLFGYPGNGKTSIAERITEAFGKHVWIPRAITMDRDIVRVFDPMSHEECPVEQGEGLLADASYDRRWVRIKRPTIVVGGELTMEHLEIQYNPQTGISEAPVQMKSNTGLLLIDDFGRQRMSVDELLNRWIVPLEKRYDYLNTSNGKKVQVPFDQLVVFSTNLEPKDLVDDAFLRRIPYKIEVPNPSVENFVKLFKIMCGVYKFEWKPELIQLLIQKHYIPSNRPLRNCHPRDLLLQVRNYCKYLKRPQELTEEALDFACENYFSIM
ncbi:MAG: hypothetical protein ACI87E_000466 [Mariniblastus sp.]|jgi:hypothetical protein